MTIGGKRRSFYGKTKKEARDKAQAAARLYQEGRSYGSSSQRLSAYLAVWLEDTAKGQVSAHSHWVYTSRLRRVAESELGKMKLSEIRPAHLRSYELRLLAEGLAESTVGAIHRTLKSALSVLVSEGILPRNPLDSVKPPTVPRKEMPALSPEQARTFLAGVDQHRLYALWWLLLNNGLRIGEALALKWSDLDEASRQLHVRRGLKQCRGGGFELGPVKTAASERTLLLARATCEVLREHRQRQLKERLAAWEWEDRPAFADLVFCGVRGNPIASNYCGKLLRDELDRLGLPRVHVHGLRHTATTLLVSMGVPLKDIARMLGHTNEAITLRVYVHSLPGVEEEAVERMAALLKER